MKNLLIAAAALFACSAARADDDCPSDCTCQYAAIFCHRPYISDHGAKTEWSPVCPDGTNIEYDGTGPNAGGPDSLVWADGAKYYCNSHPPRIHVQCDGGC